MNLVRHGLTRSVQRGYLRPPLSHRCEECAAKQLIRYYSAKESRRTLPLWSVNPRKLLLSHSSDPLGNRVVRRLLWGQVFTSAARHALKLRYWLVGSAIGGSIVARNVSDYIRNYPLQSGDPVNHNFFSLSIPGLKITR